MHFLKESTEEERARLHEYFKSQLNVPVISELEDSLYTGIYMYGTDNHLSTEGAQIRTEKVIRDLKEQLARRKRNEFYISDICFPFSSGSDFVLEDSMEIQRTLLLAVSYFFYIKESSWAGGLLLLTTAIRIWRNCH